MIKKIYSLLLGGAVALAAFATTEFVGNENVNDQEPASSYPAQLYLSWANWASGKSVAIPLKPVTGQEGVYEGVIKQSDFATNVDPNTNESKKIEYMCLTENPNDWSVTYVPNGKGDEAAQKVTLGVDGYTSTMAENPINSMPGTSGNYWDIRELTELSYDLVFTANLNTHKLTVTKYEAPQKDNVLYLASSQNGTVYGKLEETEAGSGIYTSDNVTLENGISFYFTKDYKESYNDVDWYGVSYADRMITDEKLADNKTIETSLLSYVDECSNMITPLAEARTYTPGRLVITVNLNDTPKVSIKRYETVNDPEPASSYPEKLYLSWANWASGKSVATPLKKVTGEEGVYEGVIKQSEFKTNEGSDSKIEFMCLTANQDNWSVTYTPTEQATLSMNDPSTIANETIDHMPDMSGKHWDIRELTKLDYDLVFTADLKTHKLTVTYPTGIEGLTVDGDAVYFDLNGRKVVNPENGLYIRVANGKAQKMIIRK